MRAVACAPAASDCFTTRRPTARRLAAAARAAPAATAATASPAVFHYTELQLETKPGIHIVDITPQVLMAAHSLGLEDDNMPANWE